MISKEAFLFLQNHGFLDANAKCVKEEDGHFDYRNADGSRVHIFPDGTMHYSDTDKVKGTVYPDGSADYEDKEQNCSGKYFSDDSGFFIDSDGIIYQKCVNLPEESTEKSSEISFSAKEVFDQIKEVNFVEPPDLMTLNMADAYLRQMPGDSVIRYLHKEDSFELEFLKWKLRNFLDAPEREKKKEAQKREWEAAEKKSEVLTKKVWTYIFIVWFILEGIIMLITGVVYQKNRIEIGFASKDLIGMNTVDVIGMLNEKGFTNVRTEAVEDLTPDTIELENQIIDVSCNGISTFEPNKRFYYKKEIVIRYHALQKIPVPVGSTELGDMDYNELVMILASAGFVNISVEEEPDGVFDWLRKEGEIKSMTIDGKSSFKEGDPFSRDAAIIIRYYPVKE